MFVSLFGKTQAFTFDSAFSEIIGCTLPYDDVLGLRDRMWEISPTLVRYDVTEQTSADVALAGLKALATRAVSGKISWAPFRKPISNFYQTDPISRA
jgi:NADH dehydrogenase (ubiquinone) Fe-S protein 1